ncbi:unnamed protein product [Schistosoma bovis]|nr:unnamed protein product [Schistosoma bovis]
MLKMPLLNKAHNNNDYAFYASLIVHTYCSVLRCDELFQFFFMVPSTILTLAKMYGTSNLLIRMNLLFKIHILSSIILICDTLRMQFHDMYWKSSTIRTDTDLYLINVFGFTNHTLISEELRLYTWDFRYSNKEFDIF